MLRCINCSLCVQRIRRHAAEELSLQIQNILTEWLELAISQDHSEVDQRHAMITPAAAGGVRSGAARMRAWRVHAYGGPGELRLEAARVPPLRAPDELLVRVRAASINPIDVAMTGGYGARALNALRVLDGGAGGADGVEFPLVCGRDFVGEVERAGPGARLRRGARVWGVVPPHRAGSHAQYVLVRDAWAGPAPLALDDAACGGAPYAALTACSALRAAGAGAGCGRAPRVLVLGLGGVGQAAVQLLAARGAHVTVSCGADQAALALALGAAAALDRRAPDYEARLEAAGPFSALVDMAGLGGAAAAAAAERARAPRVVTLTSPLLREMDAHGLAAGAVAAVAQLAAHTCAAPARPVRWAFFSPSTTDLEEVRRLAERGRFRVVVERVFPWWEGDVAYTRAAAGGARGKLVLDWAAPTPEPARDL